MIDISRDLEFVADLAKLDNLTSLVLPYNTIRASDVAAILDAWARSPAADQKKILDLRHCALDLQESPLPAEVLAQADAQALFAAWRRFRDSELRPLNEAKLIVVGEGNVGKTSLIKYLTTGAACDPSEPATEGVRAYEKIDTAQWTPAGSPFTLNIWDFGGQEIYYGTHRYFLTARSLYLLVLDNRVNGPEVAERWLRRIRSHAAEAPVIVVVNKAGEGAPGLWLDQAGLSARHRPIVAFLRTSCKPGNDELIAALKAWIVATLGDAELMPDVRKKYPQPWWQVKDALATQARDKQFVSDHAFRQLCEANGIIGEHEQRILLATLHSLGTVVAHGLEPGARAAHRETTLLDPNWLTQAIYAILGSALVRDQNGEFALGDLGKLLDRDVYPEPLHELIVALMQDEKLGLCLELDGREARYLLPAALPPTVPDLGAGAFKPCRRYRYKTLPGDLMPRLMVQARDMIASGSARWRDGVVLTVHGCGVLVRAAPDPIERRIDVALLDASGDGADPRRALDRIEEAFASLHLQFGEIGVRAFVPLPDGPEEDVAVEVLRGLNARGEKVYRHSRADGVREYGIATLLEGWREEPPETVVTPPRAWMDRIASWQGNAVAVGLVTGLGIFLLLPPALVLLCHKFLQCVRVSR